MARQDTAGQYPKRDAFPSPINVLAGATPYEPEEHGKLGLAGGRPGARSESHKAREQKNGRNEKKDH
jgi:hypothetical protein